MDSSRETVFKLLTRTTDEPWKLLGPENAVSAAIYVYDFEDMVEDVPEGIPLWESNMTYDSLQGAFIGEIDPALIGDGLSPGSYWAYMIAQRGEEEVTSAILFKLVQDYSVTVNVTKVTYNVDEPIEMNGQITDLEGNL